MLWLNQRFPRDWDISYFQATNPYFCGTLWKGSEVSEGTKDSKGPPDWDDIARVLSAHSENLSSLRILRNLSNLLLRAESYLLTQILNLTALPKGGDKVPLPLSSYGLYKYDRSK